MNKIATNIKNRSKPSDVFITPPELAIKHINNVLSTHIESTGCVWFDPFRGPEDYAGSYFNNFPKPYISNRPHEYTEILEGKDFFDFNYPMGHSAGFPPPLCIVSNPPYSLLDRVLNKSLELQPLIISYLIGIHNLTPKRIEKMEKAGYSITHLEMFKVYEWWSMSLMVTWKKTTSISGLMGFNRKVWHDPSLKKEKKKIEFLPEE